MEKKSFSAELTNKKSTIKVNLPIISFEDEGVFFVYCPALDVTGYGYTEDEAHTSFAQVLKMHINYTMSKRTFVDDLKEHGWTIKNKKTFKPPLLSESITGNDDLRNIVDSKNYKVYSEEVEFA
jgi:predicted RNase H-like HicB family nuclease